MIVRPAGADDVPALHALVERSYRGESARGGWTHEADLLDGTRTDAATLAAAVASPDDVILIALSDDGIRACVQLTRSGPGTAYLGLLAVDPAHQAGGLGRGMIAAAEQEAAERFGAARLALSVIMRRTELIAYYERRGFRLTGETRPFPIAVDPPLILVVLDKAIGAGGTEGPTADQAA